MPDMRLCCSAFCVDVRLRRLNRRWLASARSQRGLTLGWGRTPFAALWMALEPFGDMIGELLATVPQDVALGSSVRRTAGAVSRKAALPRQG